MAPKKRLRPGYGRQKNALIYLERKQMSIVGDTQRCARDGRKQISITSCSFERARAKSDIRHHSVGRRMRAELSRTHTTHTRAQTQRADLYRATFHWKLFRRASTNELFALARAQKMSHCAFGVGLCMHARTPIVPIMPKNAPSVHCKSIIMCGRSRTKRRRQERFRNVVA
jgi:hypothetical protein